MNDATTNKSPSPSCDDGTSGQDLRLGRVEVVRGNERRACGNAADADRRNAIQRQKILDKALIFAAKLRKHDYAVEVTDAWEQFTDAVDELVAGKC